MNHMGWENRLMIWVPRNHGPECVRHKTQNVHHIHVQNLMCGVQTNFQFLLVNCGKWVFLTIRVSSMALDHMSKF